MDRKFTANLSEVPRLVHFCFGMTPDFGERPFGLSHYLAIRSAWEVLHPDAMIMHCAYEPVGIWWELARPMLTIHRLRSIEGIYGFPASHPAHRADIIRLAALLAMGGIYSDTDVIFLRSFDSFFEAPFTAAMESLSDGSIVGLSNAILVARRDSHFARLCLEGHDPKRSLWPGFRSKGRDENYVEYSVLYPCLLSQLCPGMLKILPSEAFSWASWDDSGLKKLFVENARIPTEVGALHLWESHSWKQYLSQLTPQEILSVETTFNIVARSFLPEIALTRIAAKVEDGFLNAGFGQMDKICNEANFVSKKVFQVALIPRVKNKIRVLARKVRNEVILPLRSKVDQIQQQLSELKAINGLPEPSAYISSNCHMPLRFGSGDGSDKMLQRAIEKLSCPKPIAYLIGTGEETELAAASWLATNSEFKGVWIFSSLLRAKEIREWSFKTGRLCKALYGGNRICEWAATLENTEDASNAKILILAGSGREYRHWKEIKSLNAEIVLLACNPVLDSKLMTGVYSNPVGDESGTFWGASLGALRHLATERGYLLREVSEDGLFLLFSKRGDEEPASMESIVIPEVNTVMVRTIYGQLVEISKREAEKLLSKGKFQNFIK